MQGGIMHKNLVTKTLVTVIGVFLVALPLFGQWHSDFRVTDNSGSSYTPYTGGKGIAADADDVYITWYDYTSSPYYVRYHTFPIGSPSQTINGEQVSTDYGYTPVIATYNGRAFVTWYYSDVLYTRIKNGSWGSIVSHGIGGICTRATYAGTCTDGSGNLHVAFNRYSSTSGDMRGRSVWYQRRNSNGTWTTPVLVYDPHWEGGSQSSYYYSYYPSICISSDGVIHMSFGNSNGYRLYHAWSTNNGANWNYETLTGSNTCYYSYATSICSDTSDNLHIAYVTYPSPYHINVISGSWNGEGYSWGTPVQVDQSTYNYVYYPSICCDTFNNIWVCWDDRSGQTYEIYYNRRDGGTGSWDGPLPLTADDGEYSRRGQLAADENGNVHICWYDDRDGNYEIYYNWYSGGGGGPGPDGRDLAVIRVLKPMGKISKDPIKPSAVIANLGGGVDSCYAICQITGPGSSYDKGNDEGIVYLDPGQEKAFNFPAWTPPGVPGDVYKVTVTVYLWPEKTIADDDSTNNIKAEYCNIGSAIQVDPIEVPSPQEGATYDTLTPNATFQNTGSETATDFFCYCEIYAEGGYMTAPYVDSFAVASLEPEATIDVTFAKWICDDSLPYMANFFAAVPGDPDRELLGIEWPVSFQGMPFSGIGEDDGPVVLKVIGPNPVSGIVQISYATTEPGMVSIAVYDVTGKRVRVLYDGILTGSGTLTWDTTDEASRSLNAGLYFIRIETPEASQTKKIVLTR